MNLPQNASEDQKLYHEQTHCQSCGRFVGVFDRCPYCQAETTKRLSLRVFKLLSVLVSTVGLALLLFYARTIQPPLITIDSLTPLTNFAQVRIRGTVERSFGIHPQWNSLSFVLAQKGKNGEVDRIRVSAYGKVASEVAALGNLPQEGDEITVQGLVRFQKDNPGILLNSGRRIEFHKRASAVAASVQVPLNSSQVQTGMVGKTVSVKGKVAEVLTFPRGILIRLDQRREGLPVWVPSRVQEDMGLDLSTLDEDEEILVTGKVKPYKKDVEIEVSTADSVRRISEARVAEKPGTRKSEPRPEAASVPEQNPPAASQTVPSEGTPRPAGPEAVEPGKRMPDPPATGDDPPAAAVPAIPASASLEMPQAPADAPASQVPPAQIPAPVASPVPAGAPPSSPSASDASVTPSAASGPVSAAADIASASVTPAGGNP